MDTLIFIDSYLSDLKRASVCSDLIDQIRSFFPEYKVALLNKYPNSYNLESKVDYYFYYGEGIILGYPPQEILDQKLYERGYVYLEVGEHILENWVPLVGVTDHAASNYDGYILSSRIAESLGYKKVLKIEYDTILNFEESQSIKIDIPVFQDYLLYGKRKEGGWAKPHHYLVDAHVVGYSTRIFKDMNLNTSDKIFWDLCQQIGYYGKWIEYLITSTIEYQRQFYNLQGLTYDIPIKKWYPKSQFDVINSPGFWTKKWKNMPKVCRISYDKGKSESTDEYILFYWNEKEDPLKIKCEVTDTEGNIVHEKELYLEHRHWIYETFPLTEELTITNWNTYNGITECCKTIVSPKTIKELPTRFVYEN
jgi:hypothetical protein